MNRQSDEKEVYRKALIKKQNEQTLHEFGRHYEERLSEEMDAVLEAYKDIPIPESLNDWFKGFIRSQEDID